MSQSTEIAPPWVAYPTYTRGTIGWRMGSGEDHMGNFWRFLDKIPDLQTRVAYLRRHAPAPYTWADFICRVLFEDRFSDDEAITHLNQVGLSDLIASDIAYHTWVARQDNVNWFWRSIADSPQESARYRTRPMAFWSRRIASLRDDPQAEIPALLESWQGCEEPFRTGRIASLSLSEGLLSLAQMLCAGRVIPPWKLGLSVSDFEDTFNENMGFVDAFRLWGLEYFDDRFMLGSYLKENDAPEVWESWCRTSFFAP